MEKQLSIFIKLTDRETSESRLFGKPRINTNDDDVAKDCNVAKKMFKEALVGRGS